LRPAVSVLFLVSGFPHAARIAHSDMPVCTILALIGQIGVSFNAPFENVVRLLLKGDDVRALVEVLDELFTHEELAAILLPLMRQRLGGKTIEVPQSKP